MNSKKLKFGLQNWFNNQFELGTTYETKKLSSDPSKTNRLTPGHFLIGASLVAPLEHRFESTQMNRLYSLYNSWNKVCGEDGRLNTSIHYNTEENGELHKPMLRWEMSQSYMNPMNNH